jgi:hypothetical protein
MELKMSDNIEELAKALAVVQAELKHPKKDKDNPFFKSKYADLTQICEALQPLLSSNGLSYSQPCRVTNAGDNTLVTVLMHISGQYIAGELALSTKVVVKGEVVDHNTAQSMGSAITYARRYCLASIVGVAPEDDDDAEAAEGRGHKDKELPKKFQPSARPPVKPAEKLAPSQTAQENPFVDTCEECNDQISSKVASFSKDKFGRKLCMECQMNEAGREAK